jgi:hypothetical protein
MEETIDTPFYVLVCVLALQRCSDLELCRDSHGGEREREMVVPVTDSSRLKKHLVWAKMGQNANIKHSVGPNDNFYIGPPNIMRRP